MTGHVPVPIRRRWPWAVPVAVTAGYIHAGSLDPTQLSWAPAAIAASVVGAVLAVRRPGNPIGWIYLALMALGTVAAYGFAAVAANDDPGGLALAAALIGNAVVTPNTLGTTALVLLLFPTGRSPSPRWTPLVAALVAATLAVAVFTALAPGPLRPAPTVTNPIGLDSPAMVFALEVSEGALALLAIGVLVATVVRFRRARGVERQQFRFLGYAALLMLGALAFAVVRDPTQHAEGAVVVAAAWAAFPVAVGAAILRYRLFDIDRLVSRTVSYAVVVAVLASIYSAGVIALGGLVRGATGRATNDLVVAGSTLAAAAAFGPVRRRVVDVVDRRFDRPRYDAAGTVEAFSQRLRDEVDLAVLGNELRATALRVVQPASAGLWLAPAARGRP